MVKVVLIGAGNVATHIGKALVRSGQQVLQVYSRTAASAQRLASQLQPYPLSTIEAVTSLDRLTNEADLYLISVKDDALETVIPAACKGRENRLFIHTAGSMPTSIFEGHCHRYGVLYPMQTFSKDKPLDFSKIPLFIEANSEETTAALETLARQLSERVCRLSTASRRQLHLSAVFACNFANHCYAIAHQLVQEVGIPFEVLLPLIDETADKVHLLPPRQAQTGPAVRCDEKVMQAQLALLAHHPLYADIYRIMSQSIQEVKNDKSPLACRDAACRVEKVKK